MIKPNLCSDPAEICSLPYPDKVVVDGTSDPGGLIRYWGIATRVHGRTYRCFADVAGHLAVVQVTLSFDSLGQLDSRCR